MALPPLRVFGIFTKTPEPIIPTLLPRRAKPVTTFLLDLSSKSAIQRDGLSRAQDMRKLVLRHLPTSGHAAAAVFVFLAAAARAGLVAADFRTAAPHRQVKFHFASTVTIRPCHCHCGLRLRNRTPPGGS